MRIQSVTDRKLRVLHAIVELYIETGEPIASRTVARRMPDNLSPASMRNIMADLFDEGYLAQPHTSAGRVPTEKAFQSYVRCLAVRRIVSDELRRLRHELSQIGTLEGRIERSSHMLMEMTRGVGIAAAIPGQSQSLDQVDLLRLVDNRVLMVVVTRDQMVRNRVIHVGDPISQDELYSIRNYLNANFSGWALDDIQDEVAERLRQESAAYDAILRKLQVLYDSGLLELGLVPEVHLEGAWNLVGLDLHLTREKLRELFRALEEKKRLLHILNRYLDDPHDEVGVQVGLASAHPAMGELSLIGLTVTLPSGVSGKIAVLGPMRMDYERVMSAVAHVGHALKAI
jgi:heat-inducible transcriptional repressor